MKKLPLLVFSALLGGAFFIGQPVFADILASQTSDKSVAEVGNQAGQIFVGVAGTIVYATMSMKSTDSQDFSIAIYKCGTGATATSCPVSGFSHPGNTYAASSSPTQTDYTLLLRNDGGYAPVVMVPGAYYMIIPQYGGTGANATTYGSASDAAYSSGSCKNNGNGIAVPCVTVQDYYFVLGGQGLAPLENIVYGMTSPTEFQVTNSANVQATFSYINTKGFDTAGVEVTDLTNHLLALKTEETSAVALQGTYSNVIPLTANRGYRMRGYLRNATSSAIIFGPYRTFSTISEQFFTSTSSYVSISSINESNASSSAQNALSGFANIPSYLADRVPFGYLFDIARMYSSAASSSTSFASISWDIGNSALSTSTKSYLPSTLPLFSTTTITYYLNGSLLTSFNALASAALYLATMYMFFTRIKGLSMPS